MRASLGAERIGLPPEECVFLDDLGANLKPARALGMATIKVVEPRAALQELARLAGLPLDQEPAAP